MKGKSKKVQGLRVIANSKQITGNKKIIFSGFILATALRGETKITLG